MEASSGRGFIDGDLMARVAYELGNCETDSHHVGRRFYLLVPVCGIQEPRKDRIPLNDNARGPFLAFGFNFSPCREFPLLLFVMRTRPKLVALTDVTVEMQDFL